MRSLRFRLWTGMMVLIAIILILLWLFQVVFLENFYTGMRTARIKEEAYAIINLLNDGGDSEFRDKAEAFAFNNNLSIELLDLSGHLVYATEMSGRGQMPMMRNNIRVQAFQTALNGREEVLSYTHPRFGDSFIMLALPVRANDTAKGVMLVDLPLAPVRETASIIKQQLLYITLILLAASLFISFLLSNSFTRPILAIKNAAERMAAGDFSARIEIKKQDEIGRLAGTINDLGVQLSKIEQLRRDLIANVSHELRTPLSLIRGYAETVRDVTGDTPGKREKQLGIIVEETERLNRMVDDILNLSQLQSGYVRLEITRFPVAELLETVIRRYDVLSEKTGVQIEKQCPGNFYIEADAERIEQVLYNLVNNGFNHTPRGGIITVRAIERGGKARLEVSDTGSGIPEEELAHIWDRFYKGDKTESKIVGGTGLGLAIVKGVLEAHRVPFGVESCIGRGTTFWFELKKV